MWVGDSVDTVSPLALVRVVTFIFSLLFWISLVILMEQLYSSTPFSKKFHSWPVPDLVDIRWLVPVLDPVVSQEKSSAIRRALVSGGDLPTPKRWKRLVPQGSGLLRISPMLCP